MKFIKYIFATIAVSCLFTTSVFAANISTDYKYTFSLDATPTTLEAGDTVTVSVYLSAKDASNNDIDSIIVPEENSAYMSIGLNYNDDVLSIERNKNCIKTDTDMSSVHLRTTLNDGNVTFGNSALIGEEIGEVTPSTALIKFIFTVKDGVSTATYDSSNPLFTLVDGTTFLKDTTSTPAAGTSGTNTTLASAPAITVNGSTPTGPSITDANSDGVYDISGAATTDLNGKKVVFGSVANGKIVEATRLKVTNNNIATDNVRIFGSNLAEKLGIQGGGELAASKVKFGIVFDASNTTWTAANFTFELVNAAE